jgi:hypothetical protein
MVRDIILEHRNFKMVDQKRADSMVDHVAAGIFDHCLAEVRENNGSSKYAHMLASALYDITEDI